MAAAIVVMLIGTIVAVPWLRRRGSELRNPPKPWLVHAVTVLPFVVVAVFLIRPYVERAWRHNYYLNYAPLSLHWIYWYTGASTIAFAVIAYAVLGRRCIKGEAPVWVLPIFVFAWATMFFLLRPAITPHQPYASRRLVPVVLPGLILLAVWLASWLAQKSRVVHLVDVPDFFKRAPRAFVIVCCAGAIFLPPAIANFGGLAFKRTFVGEIAALNEICAGIPHGSSVLIIDNNMMQEFGQAIRGMCDVPVADAQTTLPEGVLPDKGNTTEPATIIAAVRSIENSGHHPLVLGTTEAEFAPLIKPFGNGTVNFILDQNISDDEHIFFGAPRNTVTERFTVYSWEPTK
jgi:hypothetical protein